MVAQLGGGELGCGGTSVASMKPLADTTVIPAMVLMYTQDTRGYIWGCKEVPWTRAPQAQWTPIGVGCWGVGQDVDASSWLGDPRLWARRR